MHGGWNLCYSQTYDKGMAGSITDILIQCTGSKLMLGCRKRNSPNISLLAWAPTDDVIFQTQDKNPSHIANSVKWYFDQQKGVNCFPKTCSWGFARSNDTIDRNNCDINGMNSPFRLCWHTAYSSGGYRCGNNTNLEDNQEWEKLIFRHGMDRYIIFSVKLFWGAF